MDTKDIPKHGPSDWRREPSERKTAILGKLGEETTELASRCFRAMIQGLDETDPGTKRSNLSHLQDEIADVLATVRLARTFLALDEVDINKRQEAKFAYKFPWIDALPNNQ